MEISERRLLGFFGGCESAPSNWECFLRWKKNMRILFGVFGISGYICVSFKSVALCTTDLYNYFNRSYKCVINLNIVSFICFIFLLLIL